MTGFEANRAGLEAAVALDGNSYTSYSDLQVDSRGRARIYVSGNAKVKIRQKAVESTPAGPEREILVGSKDLAIGDYYEGGIVGSFFGEEETLGPGYGTVENPIRPRGLIVAETDQGEKQWHSTQTVAVGVDGYDSELKGAGSANTLKIVEKIGSDNAAGLASSFGGGGKNDWFLPSRNELLSLGVNRSIIGGFLQTGHWTSSEVPNSGGYSAKEHAYGNHMQGGTEVYFTKTDNRMVRAVRYF